MLEFFLEYRDEAQSLLAWFVCLAALRWGGGPERAIALIWLVVFKGMEFLYHEILDLPFKLDRLDVFHATTELLVAALFTLIALNANRIYPLWIAAFQIIASSAHLVRELVDTITPIVYAIMVIAPSYFQLLIFAGGLIFHIKRKQRFGAYRDWREPAFMSASQLKSVLGLDGWRRPFT